MKKVSQSEENDRSFLENLFLPVYDELVLYSMSYICLLFSLLNIKKLSFNPEDFYFSIEGILLTVLFLMFLAGMILSFYHAFTDRDKTPFEKRLMRIFAGILCGFAGVWGGTFALDNSLGVLTVFPVWNIFNGMVLLYALRGGGLSEDNIGDENVELSEVITATFMVSIVFLICHLVFKLNWATTFSICIFWVTTLTSPINTTLFKQQAIKF